MTAAGANRSLFTSARASSTNARLIIQHAQPRRRGLGVEHNKKTLLEMDIIDEVSTFYIATTVVSLVVIIMVRGKSGYCLPRELSG